MSQADESKDTANAYTDVQVDTTVTTLKATATQGDSDMVAASNAYADAQVRLSLSFFNLQSG
jgi:hypothetical protein